MRGPPALRGSSRPPRCGPLRCGTGLRENAALRVQTVCRKPSRCLEVNLLVIPPAEVAATVRAPTLTGYLSLAFGYSSMFLAAAAITTVGMAAMLLVRPGSAGRVACEEVT